MTRVAAALSTVLGALTCACESVPTLTFEQADAAPDAAEDAADAGSLPDDGGFEDGCSGPNPPQQPFVCCGPVACEGQCTGQCDTCMNKCMAPGEYCCAKNNNVQCLPASSICHS